MSSDQPKLPPSYGTIELSNKRGDKFRVVSSNPLTQYESWIDAARPRDQVADLAIDILKGEGLFIDIGASIGTVSLPVATSGSSTIMIEPNPKNTIKLQLATIENGAKNLRLIQGAASTTDGTLYFSGDEAWGSVSDAGMPVASLSLDTILRLAAVFSGGEMPNSIVVKMDVEGHEPEVLLGGAETLTKTRPIMILESIETEGFYSEQPSKRAKKILEENNYTVFLIHGDVLAPLTASDIQFGHVSDVLAVPSEKIAEIDHLSRRLLSEQEIATVVRELAQEESFAHRLHAAGILRRLGEESPSLFSSLGDVHAALSQDADQRVARSLSQESYQFLDNLKNLRN